MLAAVSISEEEDDYDEGDDFGVSMLCLDDKLDDFGVSALTVHGLDADIYAENGHRGKRKSKTSDGGFQRQEGFRRPKEGLNQDEEFGSSKNKSSFFRCSRRRIKCCLSLIVLGFSAFIAWKFLGSPKTLNDFDELTEFVLDDFTNVLDGLDDSSFGEMTNNDAKTGDSTVLKWHDDFVTPNNGGLHLTLQNALDETWQREFDYAVEDWKESDAIELTVESVEVDHTCKGVDKVVVVCNANFGDTGWVGLAENMVLPSGVIVSSIVKMNEYYLRNADFDHRRLTMCHEIGHCEYVSATSFELCPSSCSYQCICL